MVPRTLMCVLFGNRGVQLDVCGLGLDRETVEMSVGWEKSDW